MPYSVAKKNRSFLTWSWTNLQTKVLSGILFEIDSHDSPRSVLLNKYGDKSPSLWLSNETYTVFASYKSALISLTNDLSGIPNSVTGIDFHEFPPLLVTWIKPSSVPAQITPSLTGDSDREVIVLYWDIALTSHALSQLWVLPIIGSSILFSFLVKSPEIGAQLSPLFSDSQTLYEAIYILAGLWGLTSIGVSQLYLSWGSPSKAWGWTKTCSPVSRSTRWNLPSWVVAYIILL